MKKIMELDDYNGSISALYTVGAKTGGSYKVPMTFLQTAADNANNAASTATAAAGKVDSAIADMNTQMTEQVGKVDAAVETANSALSKAQTVESTIETAEAARKTAETAREDAETARESKAAAAVTNCETATDAANKAAKEVEEALIKGAVTSVNNMKGAVVLTTSDLENTSGYLTEHQKLKTINGQSLVGEGDIEISGGGGTTDYSALTNKPSINGVELASGNNTLDALGIQAKGDYVPAETGKGLSTNDYTDADKTKVANAITEHQSLTDYAKKTDLPTKVSELENDKGYLTTHQDLSDYAKISDLPTKTSQLTNDSGYLTQHQDISGKADAMTFETNSNATPSVTLAWNKVVELTSTALSTISVTLPTAPTTNVGKTQEAILRFVTPSTAPTISFPTGIRWAGGSAPTFDASTYYEVSIVYVLGGYNAVVQSFKAV